MKYEMIVARYKEDVSWLENFKNCNLKITVYNKFFNEENLLPNESGREAHTYLHHICDKWDFLADYTIFTQANPFDHTINFIEKVRHLVQNKEQHEFMSLVTYRGLESLWSDLDGRPNHSGLDLRPGMKEIFPNSKLEKFEFYPGAIFMVSKNNIKKRDKSFYLKCLELSKNKTWLEPNGNGACGYFFERTWKYIFNSNLI